MLADEPVLQLVFERLQNRLGLLRIRQQHICMAAARVHDVHAIQRQPLEQLVYDVFHHELKIQASRTQLLKRLRSADAVDEILDAAHVAGCQQEHRLGIVRARRLSREQRCAIVANALLPEIIVDAQRQTCRCFGVVVQRYVHKLRQVR